MDHLIRLTFWLMMGTWGLILLINVVWFCMLVHEMIKDAWKNNTEIFKKSLTLMFV